MSESCSASTCCSCFTALQREGTRWYAVLLQPATPACASAALASLQLALCRARTGVQRVASLWGTPISCQNTWLLLPAPCPTADVIAEACPAAALQLLLFWHHMCHVSCAGRMASCGGHVTACPAARQTGRAPLSSAATSSGSAGFTRRAGRQALRPIPPLQLEQVASSPPALCTPWLWLCCHLRLLTALYTPCLWLSCHLTC